MAICTLPRETRLTVTILGFKLEKSSGEELPKQMKVPLGWAVLPLFDYEGQLAQGAHLLALWPDEYANPSGSSQGNIFQQDCILLQVGKFLVEFSSDIFCARNRKIVAHAASMCENWANQILFPHENFHIFQDI